MDLWTWCVLAGVAGMAVAGVWWKRRARRVHVINHARVEMLSGCVVEDRVVETVWRAAISMTNTSRRPRALPVFDERATVRAGRRTYLGCVYLESDVTEISPGEMAVAWLEVTLPEPSIKGIELLELRRGDHARRLRWAGRHEPEARPTSFAKHSLET